MAKSLGWYIPEQMILKITLMGSEPPIWRRAEVHSGLTLDDLHYVIQCLFGWENSHLYQFLATPEGKLTNKAFREATRYDVSPLEPFFFEESKAPLRADETIIGRVFKDDCKQIVYEYDFGDSWHHLVKLEKRTRGGDQDHIPVCLAGENAAPRDDMGGIGGYYQWLDALQDKSSDMHEEAVDWLGKKFDPTRFDLDGTNKILKKAFTPAPKKPRKKK